jgi:GT2 family glycosyltransferase
MESVVVSIVSFNSKGHMGRCLDAVFSQTYRPLEVYVIDNASVDGTADFVAQNYPAAKLIRSSVNLGYGGGHNLAIRSTRASYVLALNPDADLSSTFIEELVSAMEKHPCTGIAGGKLYSLRGATIDYTSEKTIDVTWLDIEKKRRQVCYAQFDRDSAHSSSQRLVFAIDGAAMFLRRTMLEEIRIEGEYFDEDFFAGKEDLDISWRAQLCGWKCLYVPSAVGHHIRTFTSQDRRVDISEVLRTGSIRNRYLLIAKNDLLKHFLRHLPHIAIYDLKILAYVLLHERSSLKGYIQAVRLLPRAMKKRKIIMGRKKVEDAYVLQWFR